MPLFVIPIIAAALVTGATTIDVVTGDKQGVRAQAHAQQTQQYAFASMADCRQWAVQNGRAAGECQPR
jgi:hypothetical protein